MRKHLLPLILSAFLSLPFAAAAGESDPEWSDFPHKRDQILEDLSRSVLACEKRFDTDHPVFHGCIDWHSSVHGYWALLRAWKYTGNRAARDFAVKALNSPLLAREQAYMRDHEDFEMPYGRAWFLRLAVEFESATGVRTLRPMADELARSLVTHYTRSAPKPGLREYQNAEWAFRNLHDYALFTKNEDLLNFVRNRMVFFLPPSVSESELSPASDREVYPDFFSLFGNYFHLLEVGTDRETFIRTLQHFRPDDSAMAPIEILKNDHHLGMNYSRAWGLCSLYRVTGDKRYRKAYVKHVLQGYRQHAVYRNEYNSYGHWVPQFGIYALTCPFESGKYDR